MQLAVPTADETERLAALHRLQLLDTPREARFDAIVQLASDLFEAPIAYVALVDADRQFLKAACGLTTRQSPRDTSFCGHTIQERRPLVVPDTAADARFADNPMVVGDPFIRFYAGHPLAGPTGHLVGTICLADTRPRPADSISLPRLEQLAHLAEQQLQLTDLVDAQTQILRMKDDLLDARQALADELQEASVYVRSLVPEPFAGERASVDWHFEACGALGGDVLGYHWLDSNRLAFYLVDVMGHGVGAALLASSVQTALRRQTLPGVDYGDPAAVVAALDAAFPSQLHGGKFFSGWYGVLDAADGTLAYANAGHPPGLVRRGDGALVELHSTHSVIGVGAAGHSPSGNTRLARGDRLLLYSDAVTEARNPAGEPSGKALVEAAWSRHGTVASVREALVAFQQRDAFDDDLTLLNVAV